MYMYIIFVYVFIKIARYETIAENYALLKGSVD
jgi:hypothetical protein